MTALLSMRGICKRFEATQALTNVDLDVPAGKVLALIGENGAGKSTLMKILSGALTPDSGQMTLESSTSSRTHRARMLTSDQRKQILSFRAAARIGLTAASPLGGSLYSPSGPHDARLAGVSMIYQELNLAKDLSVEDNIMLGQEIGNWGLLDRQTQRHRVREVLKILGHPNLKPTTRVFDLSIAQQQLVEIARALIADSKVIVFDEPTSSLTRQDVDHLFNVIRKLRDRGLGIVYISHFLEEIRQVCDCYAILRDGQSVGNGEIVGTSDSEIVSMMVGRRVADLFPTVPHSPSDVVLKVDRLSGERAPTEVSFEVRRGEIFGLAGLIGAGRTETLRCLFGLDPTRTGKVLVKGSPSVASTPNRIRVGLGLVSEDRKTEGLAQSRSISDNITYSRLSPYSFAGWINLSRRKQAVVTWFNRLQIKAASPEQSVRELSGGNQQKVAIARVLHQQADLLLLDEPTRGIDVGTKSEIYRLMGELAAQGKAIVFVSSYLTELLAVCDRIGVMSRGELKEIRNTSDWTEESIMSVAVSVSSKNHESEFSQKE